MRNAPRTPRSALVPLLVASLMTAGLRAQTIRSVTDGRWSDPATWSPRRVPRQGDRVLVASKVVYDVKSDDVIRSIRVADSLVFARDRDTVLNVGDIRVQPGAMAEDESPSTADVHGHGAEPMHGTEALLQVGSPEQPILAPHTARIRLHFAPGADATGSPAIVARPGGRMELHGQPMSRTWVKIGADAKPGATSVTLAETVSGWRPNDEIAITATKRALGGGSFRDSKEAQTEVVRITSIDGRTVTLDRPLRFAHVGSGEFRGEAANLARNVIVESADPDGTRGHTMFHWGSKGSISYARFAHLGKERELGRYPIHFHRVEDTMRGSYVVGAAIVDSHNRWITVHGTQYMLIRDCVGYRSVGHGFFLEDATEVYNLFDRNLAIQAFRGKTMTKQALPFDPNDGAGFWWANGRNSFTRNVSTENDHYGYRYDMRDTRRKSSTMPIRGADGTLARVDVRTIPIWRFEDNEAHTEGFYGMVVAANGASQPDSPITDQKTLARFRRIDWTGPDTKHPHTIRDLTVWGAHYAFRPHSPSMLMENIRLHDAAYGVYRPAFENHVYRNLHLSRIAAEPFNRGMDDASAQTGTITIDGLWFSETGYGGRDNPLIHMSDNNLSGDAETHIRGLRVDRSPRFQDRWPTLNIGGGARADPVTETTVPYYLHDYYGTGRHAKVVTTKSKDHLSDGLEYVSAYPLTGPDARVAEVRDVEFPTVLTPVDDQPPATVILSIRRNAGAAVVTGVTHDNGEIAEVRVNGHKAVLTATAPGVVDWRAEVDLSKASAIDAYARDASGNTELTPHRVSRRSWSRHD